MLQTMNQSLLLVYMNLLSIQRNSVKATTEEIGQVKLLHHRCEVGYN